MMELRDDKGAIRVDASTRFGVLSAYYVADDYGLNINDITPLLMLASSHYYSLTGDRDFLLQAYPSLLRSAELIQSQRAEHAQILVSVSDTGMGFPPLLAEQIFDPFFTTKPHGTGMGLRISR